MSSEYYVYVIELSPEVLAESKFLEANQGHRVDKPCVYVGQSCHTPEERFAQHKKGVKSSRFAKKYGVRLRPKNFEKFNPMATRKEAEVRERALATALRKKGYAVWSN